MKATPRLVLLRPSSALTPRSTFLLRGTQPALITQLPQIRSFSNPLTPLQTLTASRILPYHSAPLYKLIADIETYPQFIPYCTSSSITSQSAREKISNQRWPRTADLHIGFGGYDERFRSAVYCLPYTVLEAVAGAAEPTIPRSQLPHYYDDPDHSHDADRSAGNARIFTSLLTRWIFKEFPFKPPPPDGKTPQEGNASIPASPRTEVNLTIEVRFASAVYSALSQAAAPKVAQVSRTEKDGEKGAIEGVT